MQQPERKNAPRESCYANPNASRPTNSPDSFMPSDHENVAGQPGARFVVRIAQPTKQDRQGLNADDAFQGSAEDQFPGLPSVAVVLVATVWAEAGFQMGVDSLVHGGDDGLDFVGVGQLMVKGCRPSPCGW